MEKRNVLRLNLAEVGIIGGFLILILVFVVGPLIYPKEAPRAPSSTEVCTLYYLDETAKAEGQPFSLWCPSIEWIEVPPPLAESPNP